MPNDDWTSYQQPSPVPPADDGLKTWLDAQSASALELARAAEAFGALDERVRQAGTEAAGLRLRLALTETSHLCRAVGETLPMDRLTARWGGNDVPEPVSRWDRLVWRLIGPQAAPLSTAALHPLIDAAVRYCDGASVVGSDGLSRAITAAESLRLPRTRRGGIQFLPIAASGGAVLQRPRGSLEWMRQWLNEAAASCRAALDLCDRVAAWRAMAEARTTDWTGRTPARLIAVLAVWPAVSAPLAESETGASRAAIQRNLDRLAERGLIRELTGQDRYRLWTAALPSYHST